jgi:hypothetical protein
VRIVHGHLYAHFHPRPGRAAESVRGAAHLLAFFRAQKFNSKSAARVCAKK